MKAFLFCAGEGRRFRPLTDQIPKPAIPFLTLPLGLYPLFWMKQFGFSEIGINLFHLPKKVQNAFHLYSGKLPPLKYFLEEKLLGSGGGLKNAESFFNTESDFFICNGDSVFFPDKENQIKDAFHFHQTSKAMATLLVIRHPEVGTKFGAIWTDQNKNIVGFGKDRPAVATEAFHYIGAAWMNSKILEGVGPGHQNLFEDLMSKHPPEKLKIMEVSGLWFETGNEADYLQGTENSLQLLASGQLNNLTEKKFLESALDYFAPNWELKKSANKTLLLGPKAKCSLDQVENFAVVCADITVPENIPLDRAIILKNNFSNKLKISGIKN